MLHSAASEVSMRLGFPRPLSRPRVLQHETHLHLFTSSALSVNKGLLYAASMLLQ